jgi:UDP-N-acetylmuramate dehydrogenase
MIPGNIGSGPIQNIGAYGVELSDVFHSLEAINIKTGKKEIFTRDECKFGYRDSIFKTEFKDRFIIISVTFKLTKTANFKIDYADIQKEIQQNNISNIDAQTIRDIVCRIRQSKLPFPSILGNAGSFFKNPVIKQKQLNYLRKIYPDIKYYCLPDITYKVAAGWLIEKSGWKGKRIGDAGVHKDQALILVNYGNASGSDILNIAKEIEDSVINEFGIPLESEVNII